MALREFTVEITQTVKVVLDDKKITDEFNKEFSSYMWDVDCLEDHAKNIANQEARGLIGFDRFVEGYGDLRDINASAKVTETIGEIQQ